MKNYLFILKLSIIACMVAMGLYFYPVLPATMPMHWNYAGVVDSYGPKWYAMGIFPVLSLVMLILFYFIPKLDPNKDNYPKFEKTWEVFQFAILMFFAYIYGLTIFVTLDSSIDMVKYMMIGLGILFLVLGNYMGKIRKNYFVGIRLPWTIANEDVWNKTHRFSGKTFMLAGMLFLLNAFFSIGSAWLLIVVLILVLLSPIVYSYLVFRKK